MADLRKSLELASEVHFALDQKGVFQACNSLIANILQCPIEHLIGTRITQFLTPQDAELFEKTLANIEVNRLMGFQGHFQPCKSQELLLFNFKARLDPEDGYIYAVGRLQQKFTSPLARFKRFFDLSLLDIMVVVNSKGKPLVINKGFTDTLGYTWEDIKHQQLGRIVHREDINTLRQLLQRISSEEESLQKVILQVRCQDGTYKWLSWRAIYVKGHIYAVANDVSELKKQKLRVQKLLSKTVEQNSAIIQSKIKLKNTLETLQKRNFELDQFVYRTSHDLRAPVTTILGLINLARMEAESEIPSSNMSYLSLIEHSIKKLDDFIQAIQDFMYSERSGIQIQEINFNKIFNLCQQSLGALPNYDRLQQSLELVGEEAFCNDANQLSIIFSNIFSNAVKYQDLQKKQSFLRIKVDLSQLGQARITFRDNGIGIKDAYLERVFHMFFRASEYAVGSGLGLYVVKQALDKIGGQIQVKSQYGEGTEFILNIPSLCADLEQPPLIDHKEV